MSFLENAFKLCKKGGYVIALGENLFTEFQKETDKSTLYVFPYIYHAQYYRDSFIDSNNPFTISYFTLNNLHTYWKEQHGWVDAVIAHATPDGNAIFNDYLFPTPECVIH